MTSGFVWNTKQSFRVGTAILWVNIVYIQSVFLNSVFFIFLFRLQNRNVFFFSKKKQERKRNGAYIHYLPWDVDNISCIDTIIPFFYFQCLFILLYLYFRRDSSWMNIWQEKTPGKKPTHWQKYFMHTFHLRTGSIEKCLSCQFDHCFSKQQKAFPRISSLDKYLSKSYIWKCVYIFYIYRFLVPTTFQFEFKHQKSKIKSKEKTSIELYSNGIKMASFFLHPEKNMVAFWHTICGCAMQNERTLLSIFWIIINWKIVFLNVEEMDKAPFYACNLAVISIEIYFNLPADMKIW